MKQPKTLAQTPWGQSWIELLVLYVLTTVATGMLLELHWTMAMLAAPLVMLGLFIGVVTFVQSLWMVVLGMEKIGAAVGMRKSPLA